MDAANEMMLWYLAYIDTLAARADGAQPDVRASDHRLPMRRRFAWWCGRVALRVGTWLLADESRADAERAQGSRRHLAAPRV